MLALMVMLPPVPASIWGELPPIVPSVPTAIEMMVPLPEMFPVSISELMRVPVGISVTNPVLGFGGVGPGDATTTSSSLYRLRHDCHPIAAPKS